MQYTHWYMEAVQAVHPLVSGGRPASAVRQQMMRTMKSYSGTSLPLAPGRVLRHCEESVSIPVLTCPRLLPS